MNKRQTEILDLLTKHKRIEVTKLSTLLEVSQVTIRKDLAFLENSGIINREHGFATLNGSDDINNRLAHHYSRKLKIAKMASQIVQDGETIMIESGSVCSLLALEVAKTKKDVTIITNSAFIAEYLRKIISIKIILLGGEYQKESQVMVGPMTQRCAENFFVDKIFVGIDGFTIESGFTGNDYMRCQAVKDMAKQASKIMIVSDSIKFNRQGIVSLLQPTQVHSLFSDDDIPEDIEQYLLEQNIEVLKTKEKE